MLRWAEFFCHRQFPQVVLTMKKSILIVGHKLEIVCKNLVIANGYTFSSHISGGVAPERRYGWLSKKKTRKKCASRIA